MATRRGGQEWCKETKRACKGSSDLEVAESYYTTRIEANEKCIKARKGENKDCWDEGDDSHKRAVTEAETALGNCNSDFSTRKSEGTIYNLHRLRLRLEGGRHAELLQ